MDGNFLIFMPPVIIIIHTNMYQLLVVKLYIEVVKLMYSGISSSSHFFFDHQTGQHTAALSLKRCHNFFRLCVCGCIFEIVRM